jgi:pilus assembly protein CpaE
MSPTESAKFYGNWNTLFIGPNPNIRRELTPLISRFVPSFAAQDLTGYPARHQMVEALARGEVNLCLVDVSSDPEKALALIPEIVRQNAKLPVVGVLASNNPDLVLRCLRQGATDFLLQPFTEDHLEATLQKIARLQPGRNGRAAGKVYCILPAKGGSGASTIACNLAYQWKRLGAKTVLLADLDPLAGTLSFVLKLKSNFSFMDALQRSSDIDGDLWKAMVTNRQGVDVLLAPEAVVEGANDLTDASMIIDYARMAYDVALLDGNGVYGEWNLTQAHRCDEILLVTTNELTALQAAQRALSYLDANGVGRWKVRLIVNRYDPRMGLSRETIGTALHTDIYAILPSDFDAVQKSLLEGKPIPPASSFGKGLIGLSDRLAGREESAKKGSSLSGLLSLFSRTSS